MASFPKDEFAVIRLALIWPAADGEDDLTGRCRPEAQQLRGFEAKEQRGSQGPETHGRAQGPGVPAQKNLAGRRPAAALLLHVAVQAAGDGADASSSIGSQGREPEARPGRGGRHAR